MGDVVRLEAWVGDQLDAEQNALWDRFQETAIEAFAWRDHETLDELLGIIAALRPRIEIPAPSV